MDHKHNPHFLWGTIAKIIEQKTTNTTEAFTLEQKQPSLTKTKVKAFNKRFTKSTPYSSSKINWPIDHTIKTLPTKKYDLPLHKCN